MRGGLCVREINAATRKMPRAVTSRAPDTRPRHSRQEQDGATAPQWEATEITGKTSDLRSGLRPRLRLITGAAH